MALAPKDLWLIVLVVSLTSKQPSFVYCAPVDVPTNPGVISPDVAQVIGAGATQVGLSSADEAPPAAAETSTDKQPPVDQSASVAASNTKKEYEPTFPYFQRFNFASFKFPPLTPFRVSSSNGIQVKKGNKKDSLFGTKGFTKPKLSSFKLAKIPAPGRPANLKPVESVPGGNDAKPSPGKPIFNLPGGYFPNQSFQDHIAAGETEQPIPEQGTGQPSQGSGQQGHGSGQPGQGSDQPGQDSGKPGQGSGQPGHVSGQPGHGSGQPGDGSDQPSQDSGKPGQGSGQAGQESAQPSQGSGQPSQGSGEPSQDSGQPSQGSGQPSHGSGQPSQDSSQPSQGSGQPTQDSGQPSQGSGQPSQGSGQPSHGSGQPSQGSGQPSQDSGQPSQGSGQPSQDSSQPSQGSGQPTQDSGQPSQGSGQPSQGSGQPSHGLGQPSQGSGQPGQGSGQLSHGSGQPGQGSGQPSQGSDQPDQGSDQPDQGSGQPSQPDQGPGQPGLPGQGKPVIPPKVYEPEADEIPEQHIPSLPEFGQSAGGGRGENTNHNVRPIPNRFHDNYIPFHPEHHQRGFFSHHPFVPHHVRKNDVLWLLPYMSPRQQKHILQNIEKSNKVVNELGTGEKASAAKKAHDVGAAVGAGTGAVAGAIRGAMEIEKSINGDGKLGKQPNENKINESNISGQ
ncbi:uncharacterized protein [Amphiura filiformis]|uniref:uncharacterized protein n=1 Tax=Amphiura filiformis TaxID=82378 RepID=UPI003B21A976